MLTSWPANGFPALTRSNHTVTSPVAKRYNCIAWAADEDFASGGPIR